MTLGARVCEDLVFIGLLHITYAALHHNLYGVLPLEPMFSAPPPPAAPRSTNHVILQVCRTAGKGAPVRVVRLDSSATCEITEEAVGAGASQDSKGRTVGFDGKPCTGQDR